LRRKVAAKAATSPRDARAVSDGGSTAEEMHDEQHQTDDQQDVNEAGGNMKGKEPKQPKNDENCGD